MDKPQKKFGEYLRGLRESMGMTLRDVEREASISNAFLSQVERGERGIPSVKVLSRLCKVYRKTVSELVKSAEEALGGGKIIEDSELEFVGRGFEKLTPAERAEFISWLKYKLSQK